MPSTQIQTLEVRAAHLREKIDKCADIIKQLSGEKPDSFTFTFSMRGVAIVSFEIGEQEANFNIAYFMSWHQFYRNELKAITEQLAVA
jgi:hypothetical protein